MRAAGKSFVATGDHLYAWGGNLKAERFDTVENKWDEIANIRQGRECFWCGNWREDFLIWRGAENIKSSIESRFLEPS